LHTQVQQLSIEQTVVVLIKTSFSTEDCIHLTTDNSPKFVNKLSVDTTAVALTLEISSHFFFKDLLKQLVFLLDKFCVSYAAYHELCIIYDDPLHS
jgi:hypothetical protein